MFIRGMRAKQAAKIARALLSKALFPIHGHFIDAKTAGTLGLEVEFLEKDDGLWKLIWEYYLRAEVQMIITGNPQIQRFKLFESSKESLVTQEFTKETAQ